MGESMLKDVGEIIEKGMGIKCSQISTLSKLGETEIGMDSQEIVEFTCLLEKKYGVKFPPTNFTKESSLYEIISQIQTYQNKKLLKPAFEGKAEASLEIECSPEEAYRAIYEMEKWPEKLPHVKRIETLYNDGIYQEFFMDVLSDTGMIKVRSIRRCIPEEGITFFQPSPPKFLKHHSGGWSFHKSAKGCIVKTWHQWNLEPEKSKEIFPPQGNTSTEARIYHVLLSHAELALSTWKKNLEG